MRLLVQAILIFALILTGSHAVTAQDATPAAAPLLTGQGFPELSLAGTADGLVGLPDEIEAGRYLITFDNRQENWSSLDFYHLTDGTTFEELTAALEEASIPGNFPDLAYETSVNGGASADPGDHDSVILDLAPGDWAVNLDTERDDHTANSIERFTATGTMPSDPVTPHTDVTVDMFEMGFHMPDTVTAGPLVWEFTNSGAQPHFADIARYPEPFTYDQLLTAAQMDAGMEMAPAPETPPIKPLDPSKLEFVYGSSILSSGNTNWAELDLEPGYYAAVCWLPDEATGIYHAAMGMIQLFEVR